MYESTSTSGSGVAEDAAELRDWVAEAKRIEAV
jgi:hypothetical protein